MDNVRKKMLHPSYPAEYRPLQMKTFPHYHENCKITLRICIVRRDISYQSFPKEIILHTSNQWGVCHCSIKLSTSGTRQQKGCLCFRQGVENLYRFQYIKYISTPLKD